jgi:hypothetical protein
MAVFRVVAQRSLVDVYRRFRGACDALMMRQQAPLKRR